MAGPGGDDDLARAARIGPRAPDCAAVRAPLRYDLARRVVFAGDDRRDARIGHPVDHGAKRRHRAADHAQYRGALRLASGAHCRAARHVPDERPVPGQRGCLRDVPDRPGEQRAGRRPCRAVRERDDHVDQLAAGRPRARPAFVPARAVRRLPDGHARDHAHARRGRLRARRTRAHGTDEQPRADRARRLLRDRAACGSPRSGTRS